MITEYGYLKKKKKTFIISLALLVYKLTTKEQINIMMHNLYLNDYILLYALLFKRLESVRFKKCF